MAKALDETFLITKQSIAWCFQALNKMCFKIIYIFRMVSPFSRVWSITLSLGNGIALQNISNKFCTNFILTS